MDHKPINKNSPLFSHQLNHIQHITRYSRQYPPLSDMLSMMVIQFHTCLRVFWPYLHIRCSQRDLGHCKVEWCLQGEFEYIPRWDGVWESEAMFLTSKNMQIRRHKRSVGVSVLALMLTSVLVKCWWNEKVIHESRRCRQWRKEWCYVPWTHFSFLCLPIYSHHVTTYLNITWLLSCLPDCSLVILGVPAHF